VRSFGIQAYACNPLLIGDHLLGTLSFASRTRTHFEPDELEFLRTVSQYVAIAIDRLKSEEALRMSEERYRSLALENQQLYEQEQQAREAAEYATRAKDEFLVVVSHELRSPLNSILGWNRMLRSQYVSDPYIAQAIEAVERAGQAQLHLIEDLLDSARIISGKMRLEVGPVELAHVIAWALEIVRPAAESKGVIIIPMLDPEAGQITGDPDRLQQVVWNLLSNAIKFTPAGGRVHVELRRGPSDVRIVVWDTGEGIGPDLLPYVFNRFKQGDSSASRRIGGLGLGLALVKHLVELHGGTVKVESPGEGMGATFTVSLPIRAVLAKEGKVATSKHSTTERRLDGLRALVVDDDEEARELVATTLTICGAQVTQVESAAAALAALELRDDGGLFDIIVSDIGMPGEDGHSLLRKVRSLADESVSRLRAVALTARARFEDRIRALQAGFQMHIVKPVETDELITVVASLTGRL
jgi:signal transduction histidine kinase/ActR/RegA family two-component response regulator